MQKINHTSSLVHLLSILLDLQKTCAHSCDVFQPGTIELTMKEKKNSVPKATVYVF